MQSGALGGGGGGGGGGDTAFLQRELERLQMSQSSFGSKVDLLSTELGSIKV